MYSRLSLTQLRITHSDFIWDFGKLPFPTHLGKYFIKIGKIRAKIHEIGKIKAIFGLGMTPIYGLKNGQIKSLTQYYHLSRLDGPVPVFSPIYYCNSTTFISTTAKSIKLITRYEKLVPLINFSVFYNA